jgi:hypothetical protein
MVKPSSSGLQVFVSTIPATVTTRQSVTPFARVLSYRESNDSHVDGLFCSNRGNA